MDDASERALLRLRRLTSGLLTNFGLLMRLARLPVPADETLVAVDGARLAAATEGLVLGVDDLLSLIAEVKIDLALSRAVAGGAGAAAREGEGP